MMRSRLRYFFIVCHRVLFLSRWMLRHRGAASGPGRARLFRPCGRLLQEALLFRLRDFVHVGIGVHIHVFVYLVFCGGFLR